MQSVDAAGRSLLFAASLSVSLEVGAIRRQVICGSVEVLLVAHELRSAPYDVILYICVVAGREVDLRFVCYCEKNDGELSDGTAALRAQIPELESSITESGPFVARRRFHVRKTMTPK